MVSAFGAQLNITEKIEILEVFNQARCDLTAPPPVILPAMYWDTDLEALAQTYVDSCPAENTDVTCPGLAGCAQFTLYGSTYTGVPMFGQYPAAQLARFWTAYKSVWKYGTYLGTEKCSAIPCTPYTQIITADTSRVGCALNTNICTGTCAAPKKCCNLNISSTGCDMCQAQFACFFNPKGNNLGEAPYLAGVASNVNPPQACQFANATSLNVLPADACALSLPKGMNTTCGSTVNATQLCLIVCARGYVASVLGIANVTISCGSGLLSPPTATLNLCKKATASGAASENAHLVFLLALLMFL